MDRNRVLERNGGIQSLVDGLSLQDHVGLEIENALRRFLLLLLITNLLLGKDLLDQIQLASFRGYERNGSGFEGMEEVER
ncbi:hypothetical protein M0R45_036866 [Rubus argutus]|uniref:Uncharacterized protein n=1 Tax=Rubus argutus TaxID=59490 RepID=A0AAW1VZ32_RUBAR